MLVLCAILVAAAYSQPKCVPGSGICRALEASMPGREQPTAGVYRRARASVGHWDAGVLEVHERGEGRGALAAGRLARMVREQPSLHAYSHLKRLRRFMDRASDKNRALASPAFASPDAGTSIFAGAGMTILNKL